MEGFCELNASFFSCSPRVIEYGKYFVIARELANSMKKEGFVLSHVMEVGIESIMMNLPPDSKKLVMPLRFSVRKREAVNIVVLRFFFFIIGHGHVRILFSPGSDAKSGIERQGAHFSVQEIESLGP